MLIRINSQKNTHLDIITQLSEVKMEVNSLRSWELCASHRTIAFFFQKTIEFLSEIHNFVN